MKFPFQCFACLMLCAAGSSFATSPSSVLATYQIYKSGINVGQIEEVFTRSKDHYTLISTTRAVGLLAVFRPGKICLLYTSDAADDLLCVDLGGRRIIKK